MADVFVFLYRVYLLFCGCLEDSCFLTVILANLAGSSGGLWMGLGRELCSFASSLLVKKWVMCCGTQLLLRPRRATPVFKLPARAVCVSLGEYLTPTGDFSINYFFRKLSPFPPHSLIIQPRMLT